MATLTIRNLDDEIALQIKMKAAAKGRSMEAELREIVTKAAKEKSQPRNIARAIHARFAEIGGVELDIPPRELAQQRVKFEE